MELVLKVAEHLLHPCSTAWMLLDPKTSSFCKALSFTTITSSLVAGLSMFQFLGFSAMGPAAAAGVVAHLLSRPLSLHPTLPLASLSSVDHALAFLQRQ